jgi:hypothetical protein
MKTGTKTLVIAMVVVAAFAAMIANPTHAAPAVTDSSAPAQAATPAATPSAPDYVDATEFQALLLAVMADKTVPNAGKISAGLDAFNEAFDGDWQTSYDPDALVGYSGSEVKAGSVVIEGPAVIITDFGKTLKTVTKGDDPLDPTLMGIPYFVKGGWGMFYVVEGKTFTVKSGGGGRYVLLSDAIDIDELKDALRNAKK